MTDLSICSSCGRRHWIMLVLQSRTGPWAMCSSCWLVWGHK